MFYKQILILLLLSGSVCLKAKSCSANQQNKTCSVKQTLSSLKDHSEQAVQKALGALYEKEVGKTESLRNREEEGFLQGIRLYLFVSLSIPKQGLMDLGKQAQRYNGVLVLRGLLEGSYRKTALYLKEFIEKTGTGVIIDPLLFKQYDIRTIPSTVLASSSAKTFDKIGGFIPVKTALEKMEREGDLKAEAKKLLNEGKAS